MRIRKIDAKSNVLESLGINVKRLKVACYVRVSTIKEDQISSYEAQMDYYTRRLCNGRGLSYAPGGQGCEGG